MTPDERIAALVERFERADAFASLPLSTADRLVIKGRREQAALALALALVDGHRAGREVLLAPPPLRAIQGAPGASGHAERVERASDPARKIPRR
jgi:hypothetical protein